MTDTHDTPAHQADAAVSADDLGGEPPIDDVVPAVADSLASTDPSDPPAPVQVQDRVAVTEGAAGETDETADDSIDLDLIESDLADVERSLARLADDTYWVDEITGEPIPDDVLIASPTARRAVQN